MARRKKAKPIERTTCPLWSWRADRKASVAHIREAVAYAVKDRADALARVNDPAWMDGASTVSQEWARKSSTRSIHYLAREHLEYWRYRAHLRHGVADSSPTDPPMWKDWQRFARFGRALAHVVPLLDARGMPIGDNWKPEVCPRLAAHSADDIVMRAAPMVRRHLSTRAYQCALATMGLPRGESERLFYAMKGVRS